MLLQLILSNLEGLHIKQLILSNLDPTLSIILLIFRKSTRKVDVAGNVQVV